MLPPGISGERFIMTALTNITYEKTGIRMLGTKLEPWFVLVDVLEAMDIHTKNISQVLKRLDDDEKLVVDFTTNEDSSVVTLTTEAKIIQGSHNTVWAVSEPGLYRILFRSDKPEARAFTRWVTHEVLPQIRKTGRYIPPQPKKPRGRQRVAYEIADGKKLFLSDLRVRCAEYEGVCVNKSSYRKAPAEECVEYINQKIAEGARIDYDVDDYGADETYWIVADGKRIEIPM